MPFTVKAALLTLSPAGTLVIASTGFCSSTNVAITVRSHAIVNCKVALFVIIPPIQFVETVQLVNTKPLLAVAVIV